MQKPANLAKAPGVYILLHEGRKLAYVGNCADIRHRSVIWEYHFRKLSMDAGHKMPVRGWPTDTPEVRDSNQWQFGGMPGYDAATMRTALANDGWTLINETTRSREAIDWNGKVASLAEHARDAKVPYTKAYYRFKAGKTLNEVFSA